MLLLRHASAGERLWSPSRDRARRLDRAGWADARKLVESLEAHTIVRLVSSPHVRCMDTLAPLARARRLVVEARDELAPEASLESIRALLDELPDDTLVCTHREVVARLFGGELTCEKGGTWLLERRAGRQVPVAYLPPPARLVRRASRAALVP